MSGLASVRQGIETLLSKDNLADWQETLLRPHLAECHNVITTVGKVVNENSCLEPSNADGIRGKAKRTWKRLTWEPKEIQELRSRMTLNVACLCAFAQNLTRHHLCFLSFK